jgi:histidine triad (HIT) family protein
MKHTYEEGCVFCDIVSRKLAASIVFEDEQTMAFVDLRQFHAGHTLVIPRRHFRDLREIDHSTGAALMMTLSNVTRAVGAVFPNEGLSVWHSIGEAAFQEVPHLHIHIHPRFRDDGVLRVYPDSPVASNKAKRDEYAANLRSFLDGREGRPNPYEGCQR